MNVNENIKVFKQQLVEISANKYAMEKVLEYQTYLKQTNGKKW